MIYVTGDTHGDFGRFSKKKLRIKGMELTADDYVIVCGDLGLCWAKDKTFDYNCKNFKQKSYTTLWVQGNHDNFDMIAEFPIEEWHGGKVRHIVRDKVILLERGQVFDINGKTFFTFWGASSHDVQGGILNRNDYDFEYERCKAIDSGLPFRIVHESWWPQELPNEEEMEEGRRNLEKLNYKVDYVITHCCSSGMQAILDKGPGRIYEDNILTKYLQEIEEKLEYKHWYFGHYHNDKSIDDKHTLLYYAILEIETESLDDVPVLGRPKYSHSDTVEFNWGEDCTKTGQIHVIDAYGTFEQSSEPSYDVLVKEDNCLYKHICESDIIRKIM